MVTVVPATGTLLERVLDQRWRRGLDGLSRRAHGQFHAALAKTDWGGRHRRSFALVDGQDVLASADRYDLSGVVDGIEIRIGAIGSVVTESSYRGLGHTRTLIETLVEAAAQEGATIALMFPHGGVEDDARKDFEAIVSTDQTIGVTESSRHGAPMTMVRGGEDRDLAAVVAMGRVRAASSRFHLNRDIDFVKFAIVRQRLLAGLGAPDARELHFFIAEEGITAAAYVVLSRVGNTWTLEECGDRDQSGARVGALLQALIAREPIERRPTIRASLPSNLVPPQVTILSAQPATDGVLMRWLGSRSLAPRLIANDVSYWHNDVF